VLGGSNAKKSEIKISPPVTRLRSHTREQWQRKTGEMKSAKSHCGNCRPWLIKQTAPMAHEIDWSSENGTDRRSIIEI